MTIAERTWSLEQTVAPTAYPVSYIEFERHARLSTDAEAEYCISLISAATSWVESYINGALITRTYALRMDAFPPNGMAIRPPYPPLASVTSIVYTDTNSDSQTWSSSLYQVDAKDRPGRIMPVSGQVYPTTDTEVYGAVTVTYTAGYGDPDDVPQPIRHAIMILASDMYEQRESFVTGTIVTEAKFTVKHLLGPYRNAYRTVAGWWP